MSTSADLPVVEVGPRSRSAERQARRAASSAAVAARTPDPAVEPELPARWAVDPWPTDDPLPQPMLFLLAALLRRYEQEADTRWGELLRLADITPDLSAMTASQRAAYRRELPRRSRIMVKAAEAWWSRYGGFLLDNAPEDEDPPSEVQGDAVDQVEAAEAVEPQPDPEETS